MMAAIDKTVRAIFDKAIYLIGEQNDATGKTMTADTKEYEVRTVGILNNLLDVVYPASDTFSIGENGKRPALDDIKSFDDELDLDARILRDVLPCGLAARLLAVEDPSLANYFQQLFEEHLARAMVTRPAAFESIDGEQGGAYGGIEFGEFGHW